MEDNLEFGITSGKIIREQRRGPSLHQAQCRCAFPATCVSSSAIWWLETTSGCRQGKCAPGYNALRAGIQCLGHKIRKGVQGVWSLQKNIKQKEEMLVFSIPISTKENEWSQSVALWPKTQPGLNTALIFMLLQATEGSDFGELLQQSQPCPPTCGNRLQHKMCSVSLIQFGAHSIDPSTLLRYSTGPKQLCQLN